MTTTTAELTQEQRRLLEDCPREKLDNALVEEVTTVDIVKREDGSFCVRGWASRRTGAYIPRVAVESWLAEQDEREAEIERRIGRLLNSPDSIRHFQKYENKREVFNVDPDGFPWANAQDCAGDIFVPTARIRAALDRHRAEQADHLRDATKMVSEPPADNHIADASKMAHDDQSGDATEMIRYPDEVTDDQLPWWVEYSGNCFRVCRRGETGFASSFWCWRDGAANYTEPEARALAEAEAARLNAKWRDEERARRRDIAHGEALEEEKRRTVTISPELQARLEFAFERHMEEFVTLMKKSIWFGGVDCTPAQARAFLREKGIEVSNE